MVERYSGRVAVVTGGAGGIGRATARRLAAEGAKIVVADLEEKVGQEVADEVGGLFKATDVDRKSVV